MTADDCALIDQAAKLIGSTRSQFVLVAAAKEAKNVLLEQTEISIDSIAFDWVLRWLDRPPSNAEIEGLKRLQSRS
jgi:uncharacterized protein (DUF1778 family)